ncbi:hypothetical protein [Microcoleus sp. EPA2]|uniref:hypothetical protein n=1 Tax=Microcoleus sp. EPA2 TaxID=2841654 RepID=UPI00312BA8EC
MSKAADAPTLQAQPSSHISRSLSLLKSVRSPKKPPEIHQGSAEFTAIFDKYLLLNN